MRLISVNIGPIRDMIIAKTTTKTGIYKESVDTSVFISKDGLKGDTIGNAKYHGGIDQAVYIYGSKDYDWWKEALGKEILPGTFGDNLTISDLASAAFFIGDILTINDVILQITAPRSPCSTLATRMNDPGFVKKFKSAERPGLYCRVIHEGTVSAGDPVVLKKYTEPTVSISEMFKEGFNPAKTEEEIRRYLNAPIAIRDRKKKDERLQKILG